MSANHHNLLNFSHAAPRPSSLLALHLSSTTNKFSRLALITTLLFFAFKYQINCIKVYLASQLLVFLFRTLLLNYKLLDVAGFIATLIGGKPMSSLALLGGDNMIERDTKNVRYHSNINICFLNN